MKILIQILGMLFLTLSLTNCEKEANEKIEYFDDGTVKSRIQMEDTINNGEAYFYYQNGKIKKISHYKNGLLNGLESKYDSLGRLTETVTYVDGVLNGRFCGYFHSGNLSMEGEVLNGKLKGVKKQYFDLPDKKIMAELFYINLKGEQKEVGSIWYDSTGNIIMEQRRVAIKKEMDTLSNNTLVLDLELRRPRFDSTFFIVGNYDEKFNLLDNRQDTLKAINHKYKLTINEKKKGVNYIRGYAFNWRLISKINDITKTEALLPVYFEYEYFVEE